MNLSILDLSIVIAFFGITVVIGVLTAKKAGKGFNEYFLSGRDMPWWLLGISMVATTFSADTPNLVTNIVRQNGVAGNWVWWAFLLTGMLTVFVYAKLWRRSGIDTDLGFYELRYGGKGAAFLRGFRALYLGIIFNILVLASVLLAGIKISATMLGMGAVETVIIVSAITLFYTVLGGLRSVILTDLFQFIIAMVGSIWAAVYLLNLPEVGGLQNLLQNPELQDSLRLLPQPGAADAWMALFIIPLAVQWWAVWYPGAEPGGGGYIAQRMLSAKNEPNAVGATLLFNIAHYGLRPWPWILIALASLVVFPDLESLRTAFPHVDESVAQDDMAYPAMLTYLPAGLLGLVLASLVAALMSTLSTHLNWGASYAVNDFYKRFIKPEASERELVTMGRVFTLFIMVVAAFIALKLENALQMFHIIVMIGAGTGLIFILRWFWWRINAAGEIAAMVISFVAAISINLILPEHFAFFDNMPDHYRILLVVAVTTPGWLIVTLWTPPEKDEVLLDFVRRVRPHLAGFIKVLKRNGVDPADIPTSSFSKELTAMFAGVFVVYAALFGTGFVIYGQWLQAAFAMAVFALGVAILLRFKKAVF
ncbi:MAG: Na+:solute symporter [Saprospirales bacterium]|nr:MAG: Na+:solute symporter [Saprospirales bacterium]